MYQEFFAVKHVALGAVHNDRLFSAINIRLNSANIRKIAKFYLTIAKFFMIEFWNIRFSICLTDGVRTF